MSLFALLIIILVLAALFGGWGSTRGYGVYGWSPAGILLVILLVLLLTGGLR